MFERYSHPNLAKNMHDLKTFLHILKVKLSMDSLTKTFWDEGVSIMKHKSCNSTMTGYRKFRSFFGVSPNVCAVTWKLIQNKPQGSEPKHLLWCLLFLKTYNTEHVNASIAEVDEKTFREWTWKFVALLARLNVVSNIISFQLIFQLY